MIDYLIQHGPNCECAPGKPRYATLCELLAAMAQEKREMHGEMDRLTAERDAADESARHMQDRIARLVQGNRGSALCPSLTEGTAKP